MHLLYRNNHSLLKFQNTIDQLEISNLSKEYFKKNREVDLVFRVEKYKLDG